MPGYSGPAYWRCVFEWFNDSGGSAQTICVVTDGGEIPPDLARAIDHDDAEIFVDTIARLQRKPSKAAEREYDFVDDQRKGGE